LNGQKIRNRFGMTTAGMVAAGLALLALPARSLAFANAETEEEYVSRALQSALEKHGGDVNRCFEKALADTLDVAGKVELSVDVGDEGKVTRAVALDHQATTPVLLACLEASTATWVIPGVAPGTTVILPLAFEAQAAQFSIKTADAPERGPGAGGKGKAKAKGPAPAFTVKVLVDEATMRARQASLSVLTIEPANRIAMHKHPGAELLYVRKGRARVLGPTGVTPEVLPEGSAIFIPADMPHVIENMVRSAPVELLQVFAPLGPERVYRDPKDEKGRAAFDVIRDPKKATVPSGAHLTAESFDKAPVHTAAGGKIKVHALFDAANTGSDAASASVVEFAAGSELPRHSHDGSAEIIYVLSGGGDVTIGSEKISFGPDQVIHIPEGQPHAVKFTGGEKTTALQIFAPAGPEQKYKTPASKK